MTTNNNAHAGSNRTGTGKDNTKNEYKDNTIMNQNVQAKKDALKSLLPSVLSCTALKKESETSYHGACPKCGGVDRFVYRTDSQRCWCRQCKPESESMNIIDFHIWLNHGNTTEEENKRYFTELLKTYLPNDYSNNSGTIFTESNLNEVWQSISDSNDKLSYNRCEILLTARGIDKAVIQDLHDSGKIRGTIKIRNTDTVAFPFTNLNTKQERKVSAIQGLTINQKPFPYIDKNKVFYKGSKAKENCFFQCGKSIDDPEVKGIIIVEGVLNAVSGYQVLPEYCWIAIGGTEHIKKVEALKEYAMVHNGTINNGIPIICAFDNDLTTKAGSKATLKAGRILKGINNGIFSIQFPDGTPDKYDLNDYIRLDKDPTRTPQPELIKELIENAKIIVDEPPKAEKIKVDTSKIFQETESRVYPEEQEAEKPKVYLIVGKQPEAVKACEKLLLKDGSIYQRGRTLFRISKEEQKPRNGITNGNSYHLQEVNAVWLQNRLNEIATFIGFKVDKKTGEVEETKKECPRLIAEIILANSGAWNFPYITGVCETPTLRNDGSIIQKKGYDPQTGLYMAIDDKWNIPEAPTKDDAIMAYNKLEYLFKDFEFTDEESKAAVISAILTGTVRRLLPSAPAFCFDAPKRGSGKTLLANTIGNIIAGEAITTINYGKDETEFSKRIDAILFRGDPVINIDNIEIPVSGDTICSILTNEMHNPRILGKSETPKVETNILIMFTGNNVTFKGDMVRRVLVSRIDPKCSNPEDRTFDIDLKEYARTNRRELVTAALTIIRAYHVAGCPKLNIVNYGSFETWCKFARNPIVWIGKADPIKTREKVKDSDPVTGNLKELLEAWHGVYKTATKTAKEVAEHVRHMIKNNNNYNKTALTPEQERLIDIVELIAIDNNGTVNNRKLGNFIAKYRDRFEGDFRFVQAGEFRKAQKYIVEQKEVEEIAPEELFNSAEEENTQDFNAFDFNSAEKQNGKVNCSACKRLYDDPKCKNGRPRQVTECADFIQYAN
ncbi:MAG: hypothetical protein HQK72_17470 [Desulfamplus sp.]|nr:hypothetical protein [Desulfamplus sp.]